MTECVLCPRGFQILRQCTSILNPLFFSSQIAPSRVASLYIWRYKMSSEHDAGEAPHHKGASQSGREFSQFKPLSTAELVAADLRRQIVAGKLGDGTFLPRQIDLLAIYEVSRPSLREALRVLESEGLISVRRGKLGGAVVHRPSLHMVAQTLGLVLDCLEPSRAAMCRAMRRPRRSPQDGDPSPARFTGVCSQRHRRRPGVHYRVSPFSRDIGHRMWKLFPHPFGGCSRSGVVDASARMGSPVCREPTIPRSRVPTARFARPRGDDLNSRGRRC
jgi:hypothetical protein